MHDTSICLIVQNMWVWRILPNIVNMLNMLMNMTAWHIWSTYFEFVGTAYAYFVLVLGLWHMWGPHKLKICILDIMCVMQSYSLAYLTYSHQLIYMADLLQMLLSYIFITLGKICHAHIFWTIRQIDVSCICLLSILPIVDMQNVGYAWIICGHHIFYGQFYICRILITVF